MISSFSMSDLAATFGGVVVNPDAHIQELTTDSRSVAAGQTFLALKGERFDGHDYVNTAIDSGVSSVVVEKPFPSTVAQWVVPDTLTSLQQIAGKCRSEFSGQLIGITGSNGKTTVKEMTQSILERVTSSLATKGNLNNHIGVPMTLLSLQPEHQYAVIEMGANGIGEIQRLSQLCKPDVALINNIGDAHIGEFGSQEAIKIAKSEIFTGLKNGGTGIVNIDSSGSDEFKKCLEQHNCLTFSAREPAADIFARDVQADDFGSTFLLCYQNQERSLHLSVPGFHNVMNALAAASIAFALDLKIDEVVRGIESFFGVDGRMQISHLPEEITLIDDSYNASPSSCRVAIEQLTAMQGQSILVLGDMVELGADSATLHEQVGQYAAQLGVSHLVVLGTHAKDYTSGFGDTTKMAASIEQLIEIVANLTMSKCQILIKGSRSSRMERAVEGLRHLFVERKMFNESQFSSNQTNSIGD